MAVPDLAGFGTDNKLALGETSQQMMNE